MAYFLIFIKRLSKNFVSKIKLWIFPAQENNYSPKVLSSKAVVFLVFLLVAVKILSVLIFLDFSQNIFFADITKTALINLANNDRKLLGAGQLLENEKLNKAAMLKAEDMFNSQYFNHNSPSGKTLWHWFSIVGYKYKYAGENLAIGFFESQDVYNAWLNSKSHRDILLDPRYKDVGTAVLTRDFQQSRATIIVQMFGYPASVVPAVSKQEKPQNANSGKNDIKTESVKLPESKKVLSELSESNEQSAQTQGDLLLMQDTGIFNYQPTTFMGLKFLNFVYYQNDKIMRAFSYFLLFFMAFVIILSLYFNSNRQNNKLIAKFLLLFLIVLADMFLSREFLVSLMPYSILI